MTWTVAVRTDRRTAGWASAGVRRGLATLGVAGVVAAGLVAAGSGSAAAARAVPAAPAAAACTGDTGTAYATGLPPLPCLAGPGGQTRWSDNGQLLVPQGPSNLFVGDRRLVRAFTLVCGNGGGGFPTCPAGLTGPQPPTSTPAVTAVQRMFVQSRPGYATQYGEVAKVPVDQATSVGRVKGTLVLAQSATGGVVSPVVARFSGANAFYPVGTTVAGFEQYGPNPGPGQAQVQGDVAGNGPVTATLTNVTVDGEAVDTGSCRATGTLRVSARGGWAVGDAVPGGPAEYRPFVAPSYVHATLARVAATGCDDVDPAVAAVLLQSALFLQQLRVDFTAASPLLAYGCLASSGVGCSARHPAVVDPTKVPAQL